MSTSQGLKVVSPCIQHLGLIYHNAVCGSAWLRSLYSNQLVTEGGPTSSWLLVQLPSELLLSLTTLFHEARDGRWPWSFAFGARFQWWWGTKIDAASKSVEMMWAVASLMSILSDPVIWSLQARIFAILDEEHSGQLQVPGYVWWGTRSMMPWLVNEQGCSGGCSPISALSFCCLDPMMKSIWMCLTHCINGEICCHVTVKTKMFGIYRAHSGPWWYVQEVWKSAAIIRWCVLAYLEHISESWIW